MLNWEPFPLGLPLHEPSDGFHRPKPALNDGVHGFKDGDVRPMLAGQLHGGFAGRHSLRDLPDLFERLGECPALAERLTDPVVAAQVAVCRRKEVTDSRDAIEGLGLRP